MKDLLFLLIDFGAKWPLEPKTVEEEEFKVWAPRPREGLGEEWLKWGGAKIRHLESWSRWQKSLWVLDGSDWADQWTAVGSVRWRKRQKDNLLRVLKRSFQMKNQWQDVTRVTGCDTCARLQGLEGAPADCRVTLAFWLMLIGCWSCWRLSTPPPGGWLL